MKALHRALKEKIRDILRTQTCPTGLQLICDLLKSAVPHYDWVGFYLTDPEDPSSLVLGPFAGEPTEHVRIPFGRGICGRAAEEKVTIVVPDVTRESNYLSCSIKVKSEIVIPLMKGTRVLGELDVDSHEKDAFSDEDRVFLEEICRLILKAYPEPNLI